MVDLTPMQRCSKNEKLAIEGVYTQKNDCARDERR